MTASLRTAALAVVPFALALVAGAPRDAATYPFGSTGGFAGNNLDAGIPRTCTTCHASYALNSGTGSVRVDVPSAVAPGQTVAVTVTVDNQTTPAPGSGTGHRQGFETAARTAGGAVAGRFTVTDAAATRKTFGNEESVTHTTAGTTRTSWTFNWTAPDAPGEVTFYTAGNAANAGDLDNSGNNADGDRIYTTTRTVRVGATPTDEAPAARLFALGAPHPNPARGATTVRLSLADASPVRVRLVDERGRTVRVAAAARLGAGEHDVTVGTDGLAPGLYFVVAEAGGRHVGRPVVVVR